MSTESIAWPSTTAESRSFVDQLHEWVTTVDHKRLACCISFCIVMF